MSMETNISPPAIDTALLRALNAVPTDDVSLLLGAQQADVELNLAVESALFDQSATQADAVDEGEKILGADAWSGGNTDANNLAPRLSSLSVNSADANLQQMVEHHSDSISAMLKLAA
jgi:hypothetical protein